MGDQRDIPALTTVCALKKDLQSVADHFVGEPVSEAMMDDMTQNLAQFLRSNEYVERIANIIKDMWDDPAISTNDLVTALGDSVVCPRCTLSAFVVHNVTRTKPSNLSLIFEVEMNVECRNCGHQWSIRRAEGE